MKLEIKLLFLYLAGAMEAIWMKVSHTDGR